MRVRGQSGWLFLILVLAAPALIFYNNQLAQERLRLKEERRKHHAPPEGIFKPDIDPNRPRNPLSPAASESPAQTSSAQAGQAPKPATPAAAEAAPAPPAPAPPQTVASKPAPAPTTVPAPAPAAPASAPPPPSASLSGPQTDKAASESADLLAANWQDPLMSPYDRFLLDQEENARRARLREMELQVLIEKTKKERPVSQDISLQGIISLPDGDRAIVNGDTVGEGDTLSVGPSQVPVKVVRISQNGVVFSSKGKAFTKRFNQ